MATTGKKTTASGKTSGKSTAGTPERTGRPGRPRKNPIPEPEREPESFIRAEVMILLSFAAAVILFLSNFRLCGVAGNFLRSLQLGIFGMVGFVAPLLLFVVTCFYQSNRGNVTAMRKLYASLAAFLVLCAFSQLFFGKTPEDGAGILGYYKLSSASGLGGGLIGGLIAAGLKKVIGTVGAFLVLLVLFIICAVMITERSFVGAVKKSSDAAYQHAREDMDRRRERNEERKRLREEQRVRGVDLLSTKLDADGAYEDDEAYDEEYDGEYDDEAVEPASQDSTSQTAVPTAGIAAVSTADVFSGNITLPQDYPDEDDTVPFDTDGGTGAGAASAKSAATMASAASIAETAQSLVRSGIEHSDFDFDSTDAKPWPTEPVHVYSAAVDEAVHSAGSIDSDSVAKRADSDAYDDEDAVPFDTDTAPFDTVGAASDLDTTPVQPYHENIRVTEAEEEPEVIEATPAHVEAAPVQMDAAPMEDFSIPEESKRVVTAGGKVIETDTEMLKKRLESKKQEIRQQEAEEPTVQQEIKAKEEAPKKEYIFPPVSLLKRGSRIVGNHSEKEYKETAIKLQQTLRNFGVGVTVTNISCGPSVTRYELHPEQGVKVSKIVGLSDDIKLSLAAADIRIEAPIPGKSAVGIEVPNKENNTVYLRDLLEAENFRNHTSRLAFAVGKDIGGQVVVTDIAKMPHLLIAGATGSGKSVCINTLIMSIIYKSSPDDVKLIMVDPKVVELSVYNGIPHLLIPVVTDPKKASGALNWAVAEMTDRYKKFAQYNVRDLKGYNAKVENIKDIEDEDKPKKMPQIVIIVDELADLMMVAPGEVEDAICRLAQLARAAGIHLVIATQRPSVNVITGLIKANVPSRIAFSVSSGVDSRTIIDMNGAEKLLGKGDMLFYPAGFPKPQRVQGAFVSDSEVQAVVDFLTEQGMTTDYNPDVESQMNTPSAAAQAAAGGGNGRDEYFEQAGKFIIEKEKASIGMLQRVYKIGFNRAARIMDQLAEAGVVGEEEGTKPRKVLMTMEEFEAMVQRGE